MLLYVMYIYIEREIYTYINMYTYIYIYMYMYTYIHTHMYIFGLSTAPTAPSRSAATARVPSCCLEK